MTPEEREDQLLILQGLSLLQDKISINKSMVELSHTTPDNQNISGYYREQLLKVQVLRKKTADNITLDGE